MLIDIANGDSTDRDPVLRKILSILEGNITVNEMNQIALEFRNIEFELRTVDTVKQLIAEHHPNGKEVLLACVALTGPSPNMTRIDHVVMFENGVSHIINTYTISDYLYIYLFVGEPPTERYRSGVLVWELQEHDEDSESDDWYWNDEHAD